METLTKMVESMTVPARGKGPAGKPYAWMHKEILRRIRDGFDQTTYLDQALAVYLIHCELASDAESPSYAATRRKIAERAGVSLRRISDIHNRLRALLILDWKQQPIAGTFEFGENFYSLLMPGIPCPTPCTPCTRLGRDEKREICTVKEQSPEESPERLNDATGKSLPNESRGTILVHRKAALNKGKERELMHRLRTLLGDDEMARAGGNWRVHWVRRCPAIVESGLNELDCQIKEGKTINNRAAWLVDLLKRFQDKG